jgi:hypothetical protein
MTIPENPAVPTLKPSWSFWSTTESIRNEIPSVTAIVETLVAVPIYWWIALQVGILLPLLISAIVAPLVLLRSEQSTALGVQWVLQYQNQSEDPKKPPGIGVAIVLITSVALTLFLTWLVFRNEVFDLDWRTAGLLFAVTIFGGATLSITIMMLSILIRAIYSGTVEAIFDPDQKGNLYYFFLAGAFIGMPLGLFLVCLFIRIGATLFHFPAGLNALPRNFRRLTICTSPAQMPELVPGLETTESSFTLYKLRSTFVLEADRGASRLFAEIVFIVWAAILFLPAWLYRITLKSTAWFWWPLAFLGDDIRQARNPELFRWKIMGSLWARTSILLSFASLLVFVAANLVPSGAFLEPNPLLTPLGYLLLIDWTPRLWQICPIVGSILSIWLVFRTNDVSGEYRIAHEAADSVLLRAADRKLGRLERFARLRLVVFLIFWVLVGFHALLYVNGQRCWFALTPRLEELAKTIYGTRLPLSQC